MPTKPVDALRDEWLALLRQPVVDRKALAAAHERLTEARRHGEGGARKVRALDLHAQPGPLADDEAVASSSLTDAQLDARIVAFLSEAARRRVAITQHEVAGLAVAQPWATGLSVSRVVASVRRLISQGTVGNARVVEARGDDDRWPPRVRTILLVKRDRQ